jgi:hypothetical protein
LQIIRITKNANKFVNKTTKMFMLITQGSVMICMFLPLLCLCRKVILMHVWLIYMICFQVSLKNEQSFKLYLKRLNVSFMILLSLILLWWNDFADDSIDVILCMCISFPFCFWQRCKCASRVDHLHDDVT